MASEARLVAPPESEDPPGDKTSLRIAATAATFSEFALLLTGAGRPGGAVSDDDEGGSDVNAACADAVSGHDLAQCGVSHSAFHLNRCGALGPPASKR